MPNLSKKIFFPKITFGMIVLNGEPFISYNLRAIYPFAHQIIIVEGASHESRYNATICGHSIDDTLTCIKEIMEKEDTENKITIISAENEGYKNGFWPGGKSEQSQAYAKRSTGDWLWQIDVDEFYQEKDMKEICTYLLKNNPSMVFFYLRTFWYRPDVEILGVNQEYNQSQPIARIFRWGKDYKYVMHRPPTVTDSKGNYLKLSNPMYAEETKKKGWYIWHYPYLFRKQFNSKAKYYDEMNFRPKMVDWAVQAVNQNIRRKYKIAWDGMSFAKIIDERNSPAAVRLMYEYYGEYDYPNYLLSPIYTLLSQMVEIYIKLLRIFRLKVIGSWWLYFPHKHKHSGISEKKVNAQIKKMKKVLKNNVFYKLAHYLGIMGWRAF